MKKLIHKYLKSPTVVFVAMMLVNLHCSYSQNIASSNLTWATDQTTDLRNQSLTTYSCSFKTTGIQSVEWLQRNGQVSTLFNVTGTEGNWTEVSSNGSFTYLLSRDGKTGKIIVEKNRSGTFITLDFSESGEYGIKRRFRIASVTITQ